jgi:hypothetical protein
MARESPTLLMNSVRPRSRMLTDVVPDSESSNFFCACIYVSGNIVACSIGGVRETNPGSGMLTMATNLLVGEQVRFPQSCFDICGLDTGRRYPFDAI